LVGNFPLFSTACAGVSAPLRVCKALKTVVNTCTVGGPFVREVEASCAATGVTIIDVPISGGVAGAKAGTLAVMVSQDQSRIVQIIADGTRKQ